MSFILSYIEFSILTKRVGLTSACGMFYKVSVFSYFQEVTLKTSKVNEG